MRVTVSKTPLLLGLSAFAVLAFQSNPVLSQTSTPVRAVQETKPEQIKFGEKKTLPGGSQVQRDGTVVLPNGLQIQLDGKVILPNGQRMKWGDRNQLPDRTTVEQS